MHAVDIAYASRRDLCDHLVAGDEQLALVVPGPRASVPEGAPISVRVKASGLPGDAMFEGRAHEIRIGTESRLAVVPEASERNRLSFLRAWANGSAPTAYRREDRLAVARMPAVITLATPAVRREHVHILDVSDRGVRISFPEPLARGALLILELHTPEGLVSFAGSVMWATSAMVGLQLCHSFASERAAWANLVSEMRKTFGERVASSLVPDEPEIEVFEVSAGDDVTFEAADDQDDSPSSTGAYRIVDRSAVQSRRSRPEQPVVANDAPFTARPSATLAVGKGDEELADDAHDFVIGRVAMK